RDSNTDTNTRQGPLGLMRLPVFKQIFSGNDVQNTDTDIVMLITPHIIRDHDLSKEDVGSIYIATQANVRLISPPPLIPPQPEAAPAPAATVPPATGINPVPPG